MEYEDVLFYSMQEREHLQRAWAKADNMSLAQFNAHWKLLVEIHNDLLERFVEPVLDQLSDDAQSVLLSHVENIVKKQKYIFNNIEEVGSGHLSSYAGDLKITSLMAIELCQFHEVYNDIESVYFNDHTQNIMMNGENLYFLGDTI